jgi:phosphoglycerate dehydrogenase-like enzyme
MTVLVIFDPATEERQAFEAVLGKLATVVFLSDLPPADRAAALEKAEVVVARSFAPDELSRDEIRHLQQLRFVQLVFAGADNVPFSLFPKPVEFAGNTGAFAEPLAEHVLSMALALAKNLVPRHLALARGEFDQQRMNRTLRGGVCGIVGLGGNGRSVAEIMRAMGMYVYGINRSGRSDAPVDLIGTSEDLPKLLAASDLVVLTVPLTRQTRGLIGRRELVQMKPDAMLINVARGAVIDQEALYHHLRANPGFQAAIDTWWSEPSAHGAFRLDFPFFELPNLLGSPHNADDVPQIKLPATRRALENVGRFLAGEPVRGRIDRRDYIDEDGR